MSELRSTSSFSRPSSNSALCSSIAKYSWKISRMVRFSVIESPLKEEVMICCAPAVSDLKYSVLPRHKNPENYYRERGRHTVGCNGDLTERLRDGRTCKRGK